MHLPFITGEFIERNTDYPTLVECLKKGFRDSKIIVPLRKHYEIESKQPGNLLLMPAWEVNKSIGVKLINVFPDNKVLPSINGLYIHFDGNTGQPLCVVDAKALTNKRTAAASALASSLLSNENSKSLLMIGTGTMAPALIEAHTAMIPIDKVYVWGRNFAKAQDICESLKGNSYQCNPVKELDETISKVDIISSATMAHDPIIKGKLFQSGQHIDLVGSYKPNMREADDTAIIRSKIYVDTIEGATVESGDIYIPLTTGVISENEIIAELREMCQDNFKGRKSQDEITLFKSVGYALEDLVAGEYYWNMYKNSEE